MLGALFLLPLLLLPRCHAGACHQGRGKEPCQPCSSSLNPPPPLIFFQSGSCPPRTLPTSPPKPPVPPRALSLLHITPTPPHHALLTPQPTLPPQVLAAHRILSAPVVTTDGEEQVESPRDKAKDVVGEGVGGWAACMRVGWEAG